MADSVGVLVSEDLGRATGKWSIEQTVGHQLAGLELNDHGWSLASIALNLARALDLAQTSTVGTVAQAIPSMAKELRATLTEINETLTGEDEFLAGIFNPPGKEGENSVD